MRLLLLLCLPLFALAQTAPPYQVKFTNEKIKIDGVLDEQTWAAIPTIGTFWQYFPADTLKAVYKTEVKLTFDDKNIYVSAKCHAQHKNYVVLSYRRDYRAGSNDNVSFIFDTFNDLSLIHI